MSMRVVELLNNAGRKRYMLVDEKGDVVQPVLRYLKFMDRGGKARNTLKNVCYDLKHYFQYLETKKLNWDAVGIDDVAAFMEWLQSPSSHINVVSLQPSQPKRNAKTINAIVNTVLNFYGYVLRVEDLSQNLSDLFKKKMALRYSGIKGFFEFGNQDKKNRYKKLLKLEEPKTKVKSLLGYQVQILMSACSNGRDRFLVHLLWETGARIGEALSLWLEDINIDGRQISITDRGELINGAEIKTAHALRKLHVSEDLINHFTDYIVQYHGDEVDTNFVFFKLSGAAKCTPLGYEAVYSMVRRLSKKTGIKFAPHMLRHGNLNELRRAGMRDEVLRKRAGHKDIQTTKQMYCEVTDDELRQAGLETEGRMSLNKPAPEEITIKEDF